MSKEDEILAELRALRRDIERVHREVFGNGGDGLTKQVARLTQLSGVALIILSALVADALRGWF